MVLDEVVGSEDDMVRSFQTDVDLVADWHVNHRASSHPTAHRHISTCPRATRRHPGRTGRLSQDRVRRTRACVTGRARSRAALTGDGEVVERQADRLTRSNDHRPRRQHRPTAGQLGHQAGQEARRRRADGGRSRVDAEITSRLNCWKQRQRACTRYRTAKVGKQVRSISGQTELIAPRYATGNAAARCETKILLKVFPKRFVCYFTWNHKLDPTH